VRTIEDRAEVQARLRAALAATTSRLGAAGIDAASVDARALIARAARARTHLLMLEELPASFDGDLEALVVRREAREPLQLILGEAPFRRLMLRTRAGVFVPRPETELAVDVLHEFAATGTEEIRTVVDLCAGSGALAAAVLDEFPGVRVVAVERDPSALELARENLAASDPDGGRGTVLAGDVTDPGLVGRVLEAVSAPGNGTDTLTGIDAVLANPPYIPPGAVPVDPEVRAHDPEQALYGGGADGLELPRAVITRAGALLRPGGLLVMEHADVQGADARGAAGATGTFTSVSTRRDLTGRDRFLVALRAPARSCSALPADLAASTCENEPL
jgi:release factor glutamine methyltransferase